jgi:hypothetical protein
VGERGGGEGTAWRSAVSEELTCRREAVAGKAAPRRLLTTPGSGTIVVGHGAELNMSATQALCALHEGPNA